MLTAATTAMTPLAWQVQVPPMAGPVPPLTPEARRDRLIAGAKAGALVGGALAIASLFPLAAEGVGAAAIVRRAVLHISGTTALATVAGALSAAYLSSPKVALVAGACGGGLVSVAPVFARRNPIVATALGARGVTPVALSGALTTALAAAAATYWVNHR